LLACTFSFDKVGVDWSEDMNYSFYNTFVTIKDEVFMNLPAQIIRAERVI
jgi:hypothetical protein